MLLHEAGVFVLLCGSVCRADVSEGRGKERALHLFYHHPARQQENSSKETCSSADKPSILQFPDDKQYIC